MRLAHAYPDPGRAITGILELTLNAVEHDNLNIGYEQKMHLIEEEKLEEEIAGRLRDPRDASRMATAQFARQSGRLSLQITDQGNGFDWQKYLTGCGKSPPAAFSHHS